MIDGLSPEGFVGADTTNQALAALTAAGIHVAQKQPYVQVANPLSELDTTNLPAALKTVTVTIHVH